MAPGSSQNVVFQHSRDLARNWRQGARRALIFNISAPCLGIVARKLSDTDFHHFCALTRKWRQGAFRHCFSTFQRPDQAMAPGSFQSVDFQHSRALDRNWRQEALRASIFTISALWQKNGARKLSERRFSTFPHPGQELEPGSSQSADFQHPRALDRNCRQGALRALLFSSSAQWLGNGARKFSERRFSAFPRPDQVMALGSSQDVDFQIFRALAKKRL